MIMIQNKNDNPFAIRKSPVEIIAVQAVNLDDYVKRDGCSQGSLGPSRCATTVERY